MPETNILMQEERKEILKNFAGLAITTGLAIATQGSSSLIGGVLSGIAGNLASSYIEKTGYDKIKALIKAPNPSDLNHDLKKLVVKSVEWALRNIEILYREQLETEDQRQELAAFTQQLLEEVKVLNDSLTEESGKLYKTIESPTDEKTLFSTFEMNMGEFPVINPQHPYNQFFRQQFLPNLQLCFGELLKQERNRPALIAYQREVFQSLGSGIEAIIEQNKAILAKIEDKAPYLQQNEALSQIGQALAAAPKDKVHPAFEAGLNRQLEGLASQTALLVGKSDQIQHELEKVKHIATGMSRDLKTGWLEKNKVWALASLTASLVVIAGLVFYLRSKPFEMNLRLEVDKSLGVNADYPPLAKDSRVRVYLPSETKEKELTFSNEILVNEIAAGHEGTSCKVELLDRYWKLGKDSIVLRPGSQALFALPNEALATVSGRVISRDGQTVLPQAKIVVDGLVAYTDSLGRFSLTVPIHQRKMSYAIRLEKPGYRAIEDDYIPGSPKEFRMEK